MIKTIIIMLILMGFIGGAFVISTFFIFKPLLDEKEEPEDMDEIEKPEDD